MSMPPVCGEVKGRRGAYAAAAAGCGPCYLLQRGVEVSPRTRNWTYNALPKDTGRQLRPVADNRGFLGLSVIGAAGYASMLIPGRSGDRGSAAKGTLQTQGRLATHTPTEPICFKDPDRIAVGHKRRGWGGGEGGEEKRRTYKQKQGVGRGKLTPGSSRRCAAGGASGLSSLRRDRLKVHSQYLQGNQNSGFSFKRFHSAPHLSGRGRSPRTKALCEMYWLCECWARGRAAPADCH